MIENKSVKHRYADTPFAPKKSPLNYGWIVVALGTLGILASVPGQTIGVSAFTEPLLKALPVDRIQIATAYMIGTLLGGFCLTYAGRLYDRFGARVMAPAAGLALGLVLLLLSQCDRISLWLGEQLVGMLSTATVAMGVMAVGFFLLRFTGQGVLTLVSRNMIMKWFEDRRGLANGISSVFVSFGFAFAPLGLNGLINFTGWRHAWQLMGVAVGIGFAIFALITFRDNPEECGLTPDAGLAPTKTHAIFRVHRDFTLSEARRTFTFWAFGLSLAMNALFITAFTFNVASIFAEGGMDEDTAFSIFLPSSIIAVVVNLGAGYLSDRVRLRHLLIIYNGVLALAIGSLIFLKPGLPVWMLVVGNGLTGGLFGVLAGVSWPKLFGRKHLGSISGFAMSLMVVSSALGPYVFSLSLQYAGSYRTVAAACLIITLLLLMSSLRAVNPQEALAPETESEPECRV